MQRRVVALALFALAAIGGYGAYASSRLASAAGGGASYVLLFDRFGWMVLAAPAIGILIAGFTRRQDPRIEGDRVLRHDGPAMLEHWTHGLATTLLLVTGILLGLLFIPRLVEGPETTGLIMNLHFVGVVFFLFGTFYWASNTVISTYRFKEHMPTKNAIEYTKRHYGLLLGIKKFTMPPEEKYFESERMAFILAVASTLVIVVTGFVKVAAHFWDLSGSLMKAVSTTHDVATVAMLAFFLAHVFFAAVLPMSWPVLRSMITGYLSLENAEEEHRGWLAAIKGKEADDEQAA